MEHSLSIGFKASLLMGAVLSVLIWPAVVAPFLLMYSAFPGCTSLYKDCLTSQILSGVGWQCKCPFSAAVDLTLCPIACHIESVGLGVYGCPFAAALRFPDLTAVSALFRPSSAIANSHTSFLIYFLARCWVGVDGCCTYSYFCASHDTSV